MSGENASAGAYKADIVTEVSVIEALAGAQRDLSGGYGEVGNPLSRLEEALGRAAVACVELNEILRSLGTTQGRIAAETTETGGRVSRLSARVSQGLDGCASKLHETANGMQGTATKLTEHSVWAKEAEHTLRG